VDLVQEEGVFAWWKRRRMGEATRRRLTIAMARAEEELIETHVRNVVAMYESIGDVPLASVLDLYLEEFEGGVQRAEIVTRRVLAQLATPGAEAAAPRRRSQR
jgi:hypothetical protein